MKSKKFVAIILARGGSKEIELKNLILVNKKPLIYWTIKDCLNSKEIDDVWVSSDNKKILNFSKKSGANVINRPLKYAKDASSSESAWLHAIKYLEKKSLNYNYVIGLQPTSPLRDKKDIDNACKFFLKKNLDSLLSAQKIKDYFVWKKDKKKLTANYDIFKRSRRQAINEKYLENGSLYIFKKNQFIKKKNRLFGKIGIYIMSKINSFQIDSFEDIKIANKLFKKT